MAIDTVVIDGELDRPTRLRMAILKMSTNDTSAPFVTPLDVQRVWAQLGRSGWDPRSIAEKANSDYIEPAHFECFMKCLNSYL